MTSSPFLRRRHRHPYFSKEEFAYDAEEDLYCCPAGEVLLPRTNNKARRLTVYKANAGTCEACELNRNARTTRRAAGAALLPGDIRRPGPLLPGNLLFEKTLPKRRVLVEPISEAELHEIRRI